MNLQFRWDDEPDRWRDVQGYSEDDVTLSVMDRITALQLEYSNDNKRWKNKCYPIFRIVP